MLEQGYVMPKRGEVRVSEQEKTDELSSYLGEDFKTFLQQKGIPVYYTENNTQRYGVLKVWYIDYLGRVIEIMHKERMHYERPDEIEIHFSLTPRLLEENPDRYFDKPKDDDNGIAFLYFLKDLMMSVKKDAIIRTKTYDPKKKTLFASMIKKIGLTNTKVV